MDMETTIEVPRELLSLILKSLGKAFSDIRECQPGVFSCVIAQADKGLTEVMVKRLQWYHETVAEVQEKDEMGRPVHDLGPPCACIMREAVNWLALDPKYQELEVKIVGEQPVKIKDLAVNINTHSATETMKLIRIFKCNRAFAEKGKPANKKIYIALECPVLQAAIISKIVSEGGVEKRGQAARGKLERELQNWLKKLGMAGERRNNAEEDDL